MEALADSLSGSSLPPWNRIRPVAISPNIKGSINQVTGTGPVTGEERLGVPEGRGSPQRSELAKPMQLEPSDRGGHVVGFIAGEVPWQPEYWLEHRICHHLAAWLN